MHCSHAQATVGTLHANARARAAGESHVPCTVRAAGSRHPPMAESVTAAERRLAARRLLQHGKQMSQAPCQACWQRSGLDAAQKASLDPAGS